MDWNDPKVCFDSAAAWRRNCKNRIVFAAVLNAYAEPGSELKQGVARGGDCRVLLLPP